MSTIDFMLSKRQQAMLRALILQPVDLSCEQGMCGSCLTRVLSRELDHRDIILSNAEKAANDQMTICCSRGRGPLIVLGI
ncbi:2Fe-2S iron-sulfur cluster binding domain-containing protein [Rhizobium sullae]|uniref:2Fe-2S iron-sulfur cluster binding domain-containing protein n=1 Tax=Rhizobium sullae TaxID=50338 RepID=A0A2N0DAD6_RHISU|nr:2Fe-2S iron-sulfur cluster binding domain-containing protein [Rhizobium sullae]PKA43063.1 hypothetical protein CWR43_13435 [Rhizobium sullae]UWU15485.1 2Fe-2S iron-sulfur cluster binding domain-containing protein [Rhizobium sullae]